LVSPIRLQSKHNLTQSPCLSVAAQTSYWERKRIFARN